MKITVFTPTYNRAYIIENLYRSLQRQTFKDFEWLIVDDGSTDNTETLVAGWIAEQNDFPIRYFRKENGGKCRAINYASDLAKGELFFTVDSDDYLTDDALENIVRWVEALPKDRKFCGVAGNMGVSETETPNMLWQDPYRDATLLERYGDYCEKPIDGERAFVFYTELLKKYRYPEFDGEKFMTEAVSYNRMAQDGYKMRFYNDIIYIYEYQDGGLTKSGNSVFLNNPRGYGLWLREKWEFTRISPINKLYGIYTFTSDLSPRYSVSLIAECIGADIVTVGLCRLIHTALHCLKRK